MLIYNIILLLLAHWIADFLLQTDKMALNKSRSWGWLTYHVAVYSAVMTFATANLTFGVVTFIAHLLTDAVTSRVNAKLWQANERHYFFVSVGFDQWLHQIQLLLTVAWLLEW